jgi:hypothetical protein
MKAFALLLLLPVVASAQVIYDYTSGPITSSQASSGFAPPALGTDITGVITLAQPLPVDGKVTVTALSTDFRVPTATGFYELTTNGTDFGATSTFTLMTLNGMISSFSFVDRSQGVDRFQLLRADAASNDASFELFAAPLGGVSASASAGSINLGRGAPEIDPAGAGAALTLLAGMLAMMRGRRVKRE